MSHIIKANEFGIYFSQALKALFDSISMAVSIDGATIGKDLRIYGQSLDSDSAVTFSNLYARTMLCGLSKYGMGNNRTGSPINGNIFVTLGRTGRGWYSIHASTGGDALNVTALEAPLIQTLGSPSEKITITSGSTGEKIGVFKGKRLFWVRTRGSAKLPKFGHIAQRDKNPTIQALLDIVRSAIALPYPVVVVVSGINHETAKLIITEASSRTNGPRILFYPYTDHQIREQLSQPSPTTPTCQPWANAGVFRFIADARLN